MDSTNTHPISYRLCYYNLCDMHLHAGLEDLKKILTDLSLWNLLQELENLHESYHLLLDYFKDGIKDNQRYEMHEKFICNALSLLDRAFYQYQINQNKFTYANQCRACKQRSFNLKQALNTISNIERQNLFDSIVSEQHNSSKELEETCEEIFNQIWTDDDWNNEKNTILKKFLTLKSSDTNIKLHIISAVMLSGIYFFSEEKIILLAELCKSDNPKIRARALCGYILNLLIHYRRLHLYKKIHYTIEEISTLPKIKEDLDFLQILFINYTGIYEMSKFFSHLYDSTLKNILSKNISLSQIEGILSDDEDNSLDDPDIEEVVKDFKKNTQEIMDMNNEGYDINYLSFSNMKSFPFFKKVSNWFLPFSPYHTTVSDIINNHDNPELKSIKNYPLCDSDKYSLCFMLASINNSNLNIFEKMAVENSMPEEHMLARNNDKHECIKDYLMDCVRYLFVKCAPEELFTDLNIDMLLFRNPFLQSLFMDKDKLVKYAYQTQRFKRYKEAVDIFDFIDKHYTLDLESLKLYAYNLEKLGKHEEAILNLEKASIIEPHSRWTLKHLGLCYLKCNNHIKALPIYQQLSSIYPNDKTIALRYGNCLEIEKKYNKALKEYYRANYIAPDDPQPIICIARCKFLNNEAAEANKFFSKVELSKMGNQELIFAGHAAWITGDIIQATKLYRLSSSDSFLFSNNDIELLKNYNINENDIVLMEDLINNKTDFKFNTNDSDLQL